MKGVITALRLLIDLTVGFAIYKLFLWGVETGIALFGIDIWFVKFTFGIIGVSAALALFSWVKSALSYVLRCCDIYLVTDGNASSATTLFSGVTSRFGSVVSIPIFNQIIRSSVSELSDAIRDICQDTPESDTVSRLLQELDGTLVSHIAKFGKTMLKRTLDYVDECVLSYCFAHRDRSIGESAVNAMILFVKNLNLLLPKMFTFTFLTVCLRAMFYVGGFVVLFTGFREFTFTSIVKWYVALKAASFVLEDVVLEPIILRAIIKQFVKCDSELDGGAGDDTENGTEGSEALRDEVFNLLPSLEGLSRMNFGSK